MFFPLYKPPAFFDSRPVIKGVQIDGIHTLFVDPIGTEKYLNDVEKFICESLLKRKESLVPLMKGIEFLRGVYAASGLCIRPKTKPSRIETLKEMVRALGLNPEEILTKEALSMPNRTLIVASEESSES